MNVIISAKKMKVGDTFSEYADKKLSGKLDRFFGKDAEAKVTVVPSIRDTVTVELTVKHDNLIFRAEQTASEKTDALVACADRIIRQIRKNKTKIEKRLHASAFHDSHEDDAIEEQTEFNVVKVKPLILRPMSADEAILQMNMVGHSFFMFKNAESGRTNVVYKREDGNYSLLEPVKD